MIYYLNATIESQGITVAVASRYIVQMGGTWSIKYMYYTYCHLWVVNISGI